MAATLHDVRRRRAHAHAINANSQADHSLRRRASARNVSSRISLRWPIHIINLAVDKTNLPWKRSCIVFYFYVCERFCCYGHAVPLGGPSSHRSSAMKHITSAIICSFLQALCSAVTVFQFFFHTALFTWMLVEGINLYIKLVKVFSTKRQYIAYLAIGWGKFGWYSKHLLLVYFNEIVSPLIFW